MDIPKDDQRADLIFPFCEEISTAPEKLSKEWRNQELPRKLGIFTPRWNAILADIQHVNARKRQYLCINKSEAVCYIRHAELCQSILASLHDDPCHSEEVQDQYLRLVIDALCAAKYITKVNCTVKSALPVFETSDFWKLFGDCTPVYAICDPAVELPPQMEDSKCPPLMLQWNIWDAFMFYVRRYDLRYPSRHKYKSMENDDRMFLEELMPMLVMWAYNRNDCCFRDQNVQDLEVYKQPSGLEAIDVTDLYFKMTLGTTFGPYSAFSIKTITREYLPEWIPQMWHQAVDQLVREKVFRYIPDTGDTLIVSTAWFEEEFSRRAHALLTRGIWICNIDSCSLAIRCE